MEALLSELCRGKHVFDFNEGGKDGYGIPDPHYELVEEQAPGWAAVSNRTLCPSRNRPRSPSYASRISQTRERSAMV